jgi:hypothetical protein
MPAIVNGPVPDTLVGVETDPASKPAAAAVRIAAPGFDGTTPALPYEEYCGDSPADDWVGVTEARRWRARGVSSRPSTPLRAMNELLEALPDVSRLAPGVLESISANFRSNVCLKRTEVA